MYKSILLQGPVSIACPYNATRLIDIDDVEDAVESASASTDRNLREIVNTRRDMSSEWFNYIVPNQGNLTFKNNFVIERLSSRGKVYKDGPQDKEGYISKFSLSSQDDGIMEIYPQVST